MATKNVEKEKVTIYLPIDEKQANKDQFVTVTVDGVNTQIRCGEPVDVNEDVYIVLKQSGRYPQI